MRIDLHVHTRPRSPCSAIDPMELVREAREKGLDGVCLTEHQSLWDPAEVADLATRSGIRVFQGNEVTTNQGDILVFGYREDVKGVVGIEELREAVTKAGGLMFAAHPFRGFLVFGFAQLQMDLDQACRRSVFRYVDGLEVLNCRLTRQENDLALQVAQRLGLLGVAGSDAHRLDEVGRYVTVFQREIITDAQLVEELRAGRFTVE